MNDSIHVHRSLGASPERVYEAWTSPGLLQRWLVPKTGADARIGGRFRLEVAKPEGLYVVTGEYRELSPARRIVMTWIYEGPMVASGKMEALLKVDFRENGPNTEVNLVHENLTNPRYFDVIRHGAWDQALDQLDALLSEERT
ncbi:MAG: SRPBCC family protein [Terriglobia bacterium]